MTTAHSPSLRDLTPEADLRLAPGALAAPAPLDLPGAREPPGGEQVARRQAERRRGQEIQRAFAQHVSPAVVARLVADPGLLNLGGETRDVTVLFADVRDFSAIAEQTRDDPQRLTRVINAIFCPLSEIVMAHGGTIDKYIGDCVMAFWGAPLDDPDHARHAFEAAKAMLAAMRGVNALLGGDLPASLPPVRIGIGVNSGECVVGNLGCQRRFDYSVLGDPVNVAARLERLSKAYDEPLLVGEATAQRLGAAAGLVEIDRLAVRGRRESQAIYAPGPSRAADACEGAA